MDLMAHHATRDGPSLVVDLKLDERSHDFMVVLGAAGIHTHQIVDRPEQMVGGHYVRTLEHQCLEFPGKYQTPGFASDGHIVEAEIREALQVNVGLVADDDPVRL